MATPLKRTLPTFEVAAIPVDAELLDDVALDLGDGDLEVDLVLAFDGQQVDDAALSASCLAGGDGDADGAARRTAGSAGAAAGARRLGLGAAIGEDVGDVLRLARVGGVLDACRTGRCCR